MVFDFHKKVRISTQDGHGDCDIVDDCNGSMTCGKNNCRRYNPLAEADADCCQSGKGLILLCILVHIIVYYFIFIFLNS